MPSWEEPKDYQNRPVAVLGAGVLGRRVACVWVAGGYDVIMRDPNEQQRIDGVEYVKENAASYGKSTGKNLGKIDATADMKKAVSEAWLVIEAVPEKLQLKIDTLAELDKLTRPDCILTSNSSSYKTSEMLEKVSPPGTIRIMNKHYYMPPQCMIVELMTDGRTDEAIFPFLIKRCQEVALKPYLARKESTGLIFNRLWAAIKRETLTILAEGVSIPEEIDSMWTEMFVKTGGVPCKNMDQVGLDTVAFIEKHYITERGLSPVKTVDFLQRNYLDHDMLGNKSSKGGLYPCTPKQRKPSMNDTTQKIIALDTGLSSAAPSMKSGEVIQLTTEGRVLKVLAKGQSLPDGISVDRKIGRIFWTNMGKPGEQDGEVISSKIDGSDVRTIIPKGTINTPKQLIVDSTSQKVYFCDREGFRVYRCNYDGSDLETLIEADYGRTENGSTEWCVGITISHSLNKFYWTQKGPSKGNKGRIFCADINGKTGADRDDIHCILGNLPEPIDLEVDENNGTLYWTDRGEIPLGNSLNRVRLNKNGFAIPHPNALKYEVITRNFNEAIGLKLDLPNKVVYLTDMGGSIYACDLDGKNKRKLHSDENRALTGIALL